MDSNKWPTIVAVGVISAGIWVGEADAQEQKLTSPPPAGAPESEAVPMPPITVEASGPVDKKNKTKVAVKSKEKSKPATAPTPPQSSAPDAAPASAKTNPNTTMTPPPVYAGGQIATGSQVGMLGNRSIMDTPFNQTSFTAKTIKDQQARGLADLVINDPSVRTSFAEGGFVPQFQIRGFTVSPWDVALNGMFGIVPMQSTSLNFAERVEILKGVSAMLNGMPPLGSVGGTINIVPKRAEDEPNASITTSFYSDGQPGITLDTGRRFGTDKEFGVRFNGGYRDGSTAVDHQDQELGNAALALDYRGDRLRMSADLGYQKQDADGPLRPLFLTPGVSVPKAPAADSNFVEPWTYANVEDQYFALQAEYDLTRNWTISAGAGKHSNSGYYVFTNSTVLNGATGDISEPIYNYPLDVDTDTQQVGLKGHFQTGFIDHRLSVSASRFHMEQDSNFSLLATYMSNIYDPFFVPKPDIPFAQVYRSSQVDFGGIAFGDTLSILDDRLQITGGFRHQEVSSANFNSTGAVTASYDANADTPFVGIIVKPFDKNLSFYANYIQGLQQGTTVGAAYANAGDVLPPYISTQYEVGVKRDWGSVLTTLSVFQISQASSIVTADNRLEADGEQRNRGIELNVAGELSPSVRVLGGIMLLDGVLTETAGGLNDGNTATGAPHVQSNLGMEWDTPFVKGLTLSGAVIYTSSQYYDQANTQSIPDWTRFDVGAGYKLNWDGNPLTLRLNVHNVFNNNYWASANTLNGGLSLGAPRTFLLSATMDF